MVRWCGFVWIFGCEVILFFGFCGVCLFGSNFKIDTWWCRNGKGGWMLACLILWPQQFVEVFETWPLGRLKLLRKQTGLLLSRWVVVISWNPVLKFIFIYIYDFVLHKRKEIVHVQNSDRYVRALFFCWCFFNNYYASNSKVSSRQLILELAWFYLRCWTEVSFMISMDAFQLERKYVIHLKLLFTCLFLWWWHGLDHRLYVISRHHISVSYFVVF